MSSNNSFSAALKASLAQLTQKIDASASSWNDRVGIQFRESVHSGIETQCNQFIKELEFLEEFIKQARSKVS